MKEMFANEFDKTIYKALTNYGKPLPYRSFENIMSGPLPSSPTAKARMQYFRDIIGPNTTYAEY